MSNEKIEYQIIVTICKDDGNTHVSYRLAKDKDAQILTVMEMVGALDIARYHVIKDTEIDGEVQQCTS